MADQGFPELLGARSLGTEILGGPVALKRAGVVDGQGLDAGVPVVGRVAPVPHDVPDQRVRAGHRRGWGVDETLLDHGPVTAVPGLLLGRQGADVKRFHPPLPGGQLGIGLPGTYLLGEPVVLGSELASHARPPQLRRGDHSDCRHHDDGDDDAYYCSGRHDYLP